MTGGMIVILEIYFIILLVFIDLIACIMKTISRREANQRSFKPVFPSRKAVSKEDDVRSGRNTEMTELI